MRNTLSILVLLLASSAVASAQPALATPQPAITKVPRRSFADEKNAQVMRAFLIFASSRGVEQQRDDLTVLRARDQLALAAGRGPQMQSGAWGAALLGATVVLAAHAPTPLRPLFAARVHVGPALLDGGGMGAGVGGRF
jgi:hypothetical protein